MQKELFIVQRCWHSGPTQYEPLDAGRLFLTQRDAEEFAYHSAHAWRRCHSPTGGEPSVKTLLLPSYPAHNKTGSSYGFIARGSLFWVRSLIATVHNQTCTFEAYAVTTEGVIGGTGNRMSRRGTEIPSGRVFVGEPSRFTALQVCHQVMSSLPQHCNVSVRTMPIGKPSDYNSERFLQDWPPQVLQPDLVNNSHNMNENKRESHWLDFQFDEGTVVECPFETAPNPKRRRFCNDESNNSWQQTATGVEDQMLMFSS